jgi:hypothetical protein
MNRAPAAGAATFNRGARIAFGWAANAAEAIAAYSHIANIATASDRALSISETFGAVLRLFFISRPTAAVQENPRTKLNLARISDAGLFSRSGHETTESVEIDVVDRNRKLRMITRAETFDPELRVGSLAQFCIPKKRQVSVV